MSFAHSKLYRHGDASRVHALHHPFNRGAFLSAATFLWCVIAATGNAQAQVGQTWVGGIDGNWSTTGNWTTDLPTPGPTTILTFGAVTGTTVLNQDLGSPFVLNALLFNRTNTAAQYTLTGGDLLFDGENAQIQFSGGVVSPNIGAYTQTIANNLIVGGTGLSIISTATNGNILRIVGSTISTTGNAVTLTLGGTSGGANTILSSIQNDISIQKTGSGLWILGGNSTFTGNVSIQAGTLRIISDNALGNSTQFSFGQTNTTGALSLSNANAMVLNQSIVLSGTGTGGGTINADSGVFTATVTLAGAISAEGGTKLLTLGGVQGVGLGNASVVSGLISDGSGTLGLLKNGVHVWAITNTGNTFSGGVTVVAGALRLGAGGTPLGGIQGNNLRFAALGGTFGVVETSGTLTNNLGAGVDEILFAVVTGTNGSGGFAAYGGNLDVLLNAASDTTLVWGETIGFLRGNSELQLGSTTADSIIDFQNDINLGAISRTIRVTDNVNLATDFATISGEISGSGGLNITGNTSNTSGGLILARANSYSGGTTLITSAANVILRNDLAFGQGVITVSAGTLTADTVDITLSNSIVMNGSFTLTGPAAWNINGDVLVTGSSRAIGARSGLQTTFNGTITLSLAPTANTLSFNGAITNTTVINGSIVDGVNPGGVVYNGGWTIINSTNTYSNGTTISAGRVVTSNLTGAFGSGAITLNGTGILAPAVSGTIPNSIIFAGGTPSIIAPGLDVVVDGPDINLLTAGTTLTVNVNTLTFVDPVRMAASWTLTTGGTGLVVLDGGLSLTGAVAPTLLVNQPGGMVINNGIDLSADAVAHFLTLRGIGAGGITVNGEIADGTTPGGGLTILSGTTILNGTNSFSGGTSLQAGMLVIGNNDALGTGNLLVTGTGVLKASDGTPRTVGNLITVGSSFTITGNTTLTLAGNTVISGSARTITNNNVETVYDGTITLGSVAPISVLTFGGSGTSLINGSIVDGSVPGGLVFSAGNYFINGNNTYSGGTTITGGRVNVIDLSTAFGSGTLALNGGILYSASGGTLSNLVTFGGTVTLSGNLTDVVIDGPDMVYITAATSLSNGFNSLTINDELRMAANFTVSGGNLVTFSGGVSLTGPAVQTLFVNNPGGVVINNGINLSADGLVHSLTLRGVGLGGLTVNGTITDGLAAGGSITVLSGTVILNGANNYTGNTTLHLGTIGIGDNQALSTGILNVSGSNTFLRAEGDARTITNDILLQATSGVFTLTGANSLTLGGNITVSGGNRAVNNAAIAPLYVTGNVILGDAGNDRVLTLSGSSLTELQLLGNIVDGTGASAGSVIYGSGTYVIAGNNTYGGPTGIATSTITLATNNAFSSSAITITSATFRTDDSARTISNDIALWGTLTTLNTQTLTLAGEISMTAARTIQANGAQQLILHDIQLVTPTSPYALTISGSGGVTMTGVMSQSAAADVALSITNTGGVTILGQNTFGGATTVGTGATLYLGNGSGTSGNLSGTLNVASATSRVVFNYDEIVSFGLTSTANIIGALGNVEVNSPLGGGVRFDRANTYTGITTITQGTLQYGVDNAIAVTTTVAVNSTGTWDLNGFSAAVATLSDGIGGGGYVTNNAVGAFVLSLTQGAFSGTIQGANLGLVKLGAGSLTLSGNNSFSGQSTLAAGILAIGHEKALGTADWFILGGTLRNDGLARTLENNFTLSGAVTVTGDSALVLDGALVIVNTNATLTNGNVAAPLTISGPITLGDNTAAQSLLLSTPATGTIVLSGPIGDGAVAGGALAFTTGSFLVSGDNTYTGLTSLLSGTVTLAGGTPFGSSTVQWTGGTLQPDDSPRTLTNSTVNLLGNVIVAGSQQLGLSGTLYATAARNIGITNTAGLLLGNVNLSAGTAFVVTFTGPGSLTVSGIINQPTTTNAGIVLSTTGGATFLGNNTYGGFTTVNAGVTLTLGSGIGSTGNLTGTLSIVAGGSVVLNYGAMTGYGLSSTANIIGAGSVEINGAADGGVIFNRANTYTGVTTVTQGTLRFGVLNAIPVTSAVVLNSTGTLDINGFNTGITTLSDGVAGGGYIISNSGAAVLSITQGAFSGTVLGTNLGFQKLGAGVLTLNSSNQFTAQSTLAGGTLILDNNLALGTADLRITAATAIQAGENPLTLSNNIIMSANWTISGTRDVTIASAVTFIPGTTRTLFINNTGTTSINSINQGAQNNTFSLVVSATDGAHLLLGGIGRGTSTSAGLTFTGGASTVRLTNLSGTINPSAMVIGGDANVILQGNDNVISVTTALTFSNNGVLTLSGWNQTFTSIATTLVTNRITNSGSSESVLAVNGGSFLGVIDDGSGSIALNKLSSGTFILGNDNLFTGRVTVAAGTLQVGTGGSTGSLQASALTLTGNLLWNSSGSFTYTGDVAGTGALTFTGGGTYVLNGSVTHSGATTVGNNTIVTYGPNTVRTGAAPINVMNNAILNLQNAVMGTGAVALANGSRLTGQGSIGGVVTANLGSDIFIGGDGTVGTLTLGNLTLVGGSINFDLGTESDLLRVMSLTQPNITASSYLNLNAVTGFTGGIFTLINGYNGTLSAASLNQLIINGPAGYSYSLNNILGSLSIEFTAATQKLWVGSLAAGGNIWDVGTTANFTLSGSPAVYNNGDAVTFDDSAVVTDITISNNGNAVVPVSVLVVNTAQTFTFRGDPIGGSNGIDKQGTGILVLANDNTFTGAVQVSRGTLQLGDGFNTGSITPTLGIQLENDSTLLVNRSGTIALAGNITGSGNLVKTGDGVLNLSGTNTYLGHMTILGGTVQILGGTLSANPATQITVSGVGSNFTIASVGSMSAPTLNVDGQGQANVISGSLGVSVLNMLSGTFNVNFGNVGVTAALNMGGEAGTIAVFNLAAGTTLNLPNNGTTYNGANGALGTIINGPGSLNLGAIRNITVTKSTGLDADTPELTINALITAASAFNKLGDGMLYITGSNSMNVASILTGGTLMLGHSYALGATSTLSIFVGTTLRGDGTTLDLNNPISQRGSFRITGSSDINFLAPVTASNNQTMTIDNVGLTRFSNYILANNNQGTTQTIAGSGHVQFDLISAGIGTTNDNIAFNGTGIYDLMGANTLSGTIAVRSGTVRVFDQGAFGPTPNQVTILGGLVGGDVTLLTMGNLNLTQNINVLNSTGASITFGNLSALTSTFSGSMALGNAVNITTTAGGTVVVTGTVSSTGGISKIGDGTLWLYGNNTFTGVSTVQAGVLQVGGATGLGLGGKWAVNQGAVLDLNGFAQTFTNLNDGVDGGGTITSGAAGPVDITVQAGLFGGVIADGTDSTAILSLNKTTAGVLVLTNTNTYSGITTVSAGTLQLGNGGANGSVASLSIVNNGTLAFNRSGNYDYNGVISGNGSVQVNGGQLTLGGTNTYSGTTIVQSAELVVAGGIASSTVSVLSGGTLSGGGSIGGAVNVSVGATLNGDLTIAGNLTSSGTINPGGLGTIGDLTLSGLILNGGLLNFDLGTIGLGNGDRLLLTGLAAPIISGSTTFNINALTGFGAGTYSLLSGYTGTISSGFENFLTNSLFGYNFSLQNNDGSLDLLVELLPDQLLNWTGSANGSWDTVSLNWAGTATTFTNNVSSVTFDNGSAVNNITVTDSGVSPLSMTVSNDGSHNYVFTGGNISGFSSTSTLYKDGAGILAFANNVSFSGGAIINGGTLQIGVSGNSGSFTGNIVNNALVVFNRTDGLTYSQQISGTGDVSILTGSVSFAGDQTYSGATTIASGSLLQVMGSLASATVDVAGTLQLYTDATQTYGGVLQGSGFLQKLGSGTSILTGANTFNGITSIDAGTLFVNQALSGTVYVNAGGAFTGTGTSGSTVIVNGGSGSISGTQAGTLDVNTGTVTVAGGGVTTGTVNLGGGSLIVQSGGAIGNTLGVNLTGGVLNVNSGGAIVGSGQTTINGGTLVANGNVSGLVVVNGGTLQGNGGTVGAIVVNNGGTLSPGNSVGTLTVDGSGVTGGASLTFNGGSNIIFEFNNATGTAGGAGIGGWDYIDMVSSGGTLLVDATAANKINIEIRSLTNPFTNPPGNLAGAADNFDTSPGVAGSIQEYYWKFIGLTDDSKLVLDGLGNLTNRFNIIDDGLGGVFYEPGSPNGNPFERPYSSLGKGTFSVVAGTYDGSYGLYIRYSAVPEPGSMILCGLGSLAAGWYGRRRRRKQAGEGLAADAAQESAPPSAPEVIS